MSLTKPELKYFIFGFTALAITTAISLWIPMQIGHLVDVLKLPPDQAVDKLKGMAYILGTLFTISGIGTMSRIYFTSIAGQKIVSRLRKTLYEKILKQDIKFFNETSKSSGELVNRLSTDVQIISDTLTNSCIHGLKSIFEAIGGFAFLLYLSTNLTLWTGAAFPALVIVAMLYGRFIRTKYKKYMDTLSDATSLAEDKISNIKTIKIFGTQEKEIKKYSEKVNEIFQLGKKVDTVKSIFYASIYTATNMVLLVILCHGGLNVISGGMTIGELSSFLLYSIYMGMSLSGLASTWSDIMEASE